MNNLGPILLLLICLASCKPKGSQFEGKWKPFGETYGVPNAVLTISKSGDNYILTHDNPYTVMMTMVYDNELNRLTGNDGMRTMDVTHDSKQDHLILVGRGGFDNKPIELQRAK